MEQHCVIKWAEWEQHCVIKWAEWEQHCVIKRAEWQGDGGRQTAAAAAASK